MTRYLLDTNVIAALVRDPHGPVARRIREVGEADVCTSVIVAAEVWYGAARRGSPRLSKQCEAVLGGLEIVPFAPPADRFYARERTRLEALGRPVGGNDLLIAAHALALGCTVVTDNEREFGRIVDLRRENWLR